MYLTVLLTTCELLHFAKAESEVKIFHKTQRTNFHALIHSYFHMHIEILKQDMSSAAKIQKMVLKKLKSKTNLLQAED